MNVVALEPYKPVERQWPEPKPLPPDLPPVQAFDLDLLPAALRPWIADIAERMQCPPDFLAVTAMVAAGAAVGRKVGIRPQAQTDWLEVPNLWGMVVGRPGVMKSPAMKQALAPLLRLDKQAADANASALKHHAADLAAWKAEKDARDGAVKAAAKTAAKKGEEVDVSGLSTAAPPDAPAARQLITNDTSYEALGVVMADNPNGVLAYRDELVGLLKPLDRDENAAARGFFLQAWNGTDGYTFDRIMRGKLRIEACCLSLLGATQPDKLASYFRTAVQGGEGNDGFAQRFGLLVWPDLAPGWHDVDRYPDGDAKRAANLLFERLAELDADGVGAERDAFDPIPFLRFDDDAQTVFRAWRADLERRIRSGDLHPVMEAHLSKYRGLAPKLALLCHLLDGGAGPVTLDALSRALGWTAYLETHAQRAYAAVTAGEKSGARIIVAKLRSGDLASPFTARDVHQRDWSGLTDRERVGAALALLVDHDLIGEVREDTGGRPTIIYTVSPWALQ